MKLLNWIFGDRFAEKYGKALLEYFESEDFPEELLQYHTINLLYREFMYRKACRRGEEEGMELVDYLEAMVEEQRRQWAKEREKNGQ